MRQVCAQTLIENLSCVKEQEQIHISARARIVLDSEIENAIKHGVKLKFIYQLRYKNKIFSIPYSVYFNHLTRLYILESPAMMNRSFSDLYALIDELEIFLWRVNLNNITEVDDYKKLQLRIYFAREELPFALRWEALFSDIWNLSSPWQSCAN